VSALAVAAAAALVLAGALALAVRAAVRSDAFRERVGAAARERIGREVGYASLDLALAPLRAVLEGAFLAGSGPRRPPLLEAERAELPLDLWALLRGDAPARALAFERGRLRPARGLSLPLRDGRIELRPQAGSLGVDAAASLAGGGALRAQGRLGEAWALDVELEAVDLGALGESLASVSPLAGRASGALRLRGPADALEEVRAELAVEDARLGIEDIHLEGRLGATLELPPGRFAIDATGAELWTRGPVRYRKPAGQHASVTGRFVRRPDGGFDLLEARLHVK
jgi:hypothetical protein